MRTLIFSLFLCVAACGGHDDPTSDKTPPGGKAAADSAKQVPKSVKILVVPFGREDRNKDTGEFSVGFATFLTERLEEIGEDKESAAKLADTGIAVGSVSGPVILTEDQIALRDDAGLPFDADAARKAAEAQGATHVLTGSYAGDVGKFRLRVDLYEVAPGGQLTLRGSASVGPTLVYAVKVPHPGMQIGAVHAMLGDAAASAFASAKLPLPENAVAALKTPQTPDALSYLEYARALRRHFRPLDPSKHREALDFASHAVSIWPDYWAARRLYAMLLWRQGDLAKAQIHFQEVIHPTQQDGKPQRAGLPDDLRSTVMLGRIALDLGDAEGASVLLENVAARRPDDAQTRFMLGQAYAKLGQNDKAVAALEAARALAPTDLEVRRALAALYANARRYAEAVAELMFVVDREPQNLDAVYLLAACLRAAGKGEEAVKTYGDAVPRFPKEAPLRKFRGDGLLVLGRPEEASAAYAEALALASKDARLDGSDPDMLHGETLMLRIRDAKSDRDGMEKVRAEFQDAVNDATWDLAWNGKAACEDGRAGSGYLFAKERGRRYADIGERFQASANRIDAALKNGEHLALTPDERADAEAVVRYLADALRDLRETRTAYDGGLKPLLRDRGCETDPSKIRVATIEEIRARNLKRDVIMPDPGKKDSSGISPVVPDGAVASVTFYFENRSGAEYVLVLDGKPMEPSIAPLPKSLISRYDLEKKTVPTDDLQNYSAPPGYHDFCFMPKGQEARCGKPGTVRSDHIHEGWRVIIQ